MKTVIYTQRVEIIESYNERRDCADQNIPRFIEACGYLPIPVPNVLTNAEDFVDAVKPVGIILTGGNSLVAYGGTAPERDDTDRRMIEIALKRGIPIYGFCRGMQSLVDYFDCKLEQVTGHVAIRHIAEGSWGMLEVNSYHNQACKEIKDPLVVTMQTADGVIEAISCKKYPLIGTMWHPERENPFRNEDVDRVRKLFG